MGLPCAARNVKHIAPPMTSESTTPSSASTTPSLSEIFDPPSTATNGCRGELRRPSRTSTSFRRRSPIAEGSVCGGPTIEACARWHAPNASSTYMSMPSMSRATNPASLPSSPASNRRFSISSTPGASSASRARTGSIEYLGFGLPFGRPRCDAVTTLAPRDVSHSMVGSAARMRKSSVMTCSPSRSSIGTLKSVRTSTRLPATSPRSSSVGIAFTAAALTSSCAWPPWHRRRA